MDLISTEFFQKLILGGLTTATGCVAYFARQIIKNQIDLLKLYNSIGDLSKEVDLLKSSVTNAQKSMREFEISQQQSHNQITAEISKLNTLVSYKVKR